MYKLYREQRQLENIRPEDIPKQWISQIFNTEFNLAFPPPANDTCDEFAVNLRQAVLLLREKKYKRIMIHI